MATDKTLEQLEDEAGCFLAMPKEKYYAFLAKKKVAKIRRKSQKKE